MRFYDRDEEIATLSQIVKQSREQSRMTVLVGRRRIGKTELAKRCGDTRILYFFVARKAESLLCEDFAREAENKLGIPIGHFTSVADLFGYLLQLSEYQPFTIIMDEFQDFYRINSAVFSEIQNQWDRYKDRAHLNLIISGSIFTMMKHIFEDSKEPLFARAQKRITVRPFKTSVLKSILSDYNPQYTPDDLLTLYAITGGVAWYVTLLMDDGCYDRRKMLEALTDRNSLFVNEGRNILVEEFGKEDRLFDFLGALFAQNILDKDNPQDEAARLYYHVGKLNTYEITLIPNIESSLQPGDSNAITSIEWNGRLCRLEASIVNLFILNQIDRGSLKNNTVRILFGNKTFCELKVVATR